MREYERMGSIDSQFRIWNIARISESKKSATGGINRLKTPIPLTEVVLDDIVFSTTAHSLKMRSLNLSLKQTKILATMLPNAIIKINDLSKDSIDTFVGVLLFADVSGFTSLCEKYNGFGKSGSDKLTATLNNYLGAMVEVIYKYNGDVLKFSGDAILALWKLENHEYMYSLIHRVICCALYIQSALGVYETDVKILLKVKLAISAGNMTFTVIGNDNSRHYLIAGSPVYEVKSAEKACTSGEVVLSFSAWGHLSLVNYEHTWKDDDHVKIIRIIYNPENAKREILRSEVASYYKNDHRRPPKDPSRKKMGISNSISEVRAIVDEATKRDLSSELRTFLIPPVIQQIDADLPMEYLSEMRTITVMFINIIPNRLHTKALIDLVDKAYVIICSLVYKAMGSVNKVSLFDKDVMVLAIFGLRGFNHEGEVAGCLKCGYNIMEACCSLEGVISVSVGVTTGIAYCGVVGHPLRREYTVIGAVVNKAARLMCSYPGKVTCDRDTFLLSNLASRFFTVQERKPLKGIEDTGPIYEYTQKKGENTLEAMNDGMYPILGRQNEIMIFNSILQSLQNHNCWEKAILLTGPARIGKSRLLDEMILEAHKKGFEPIVISLHNVHSAMTYGTAQCIIKQILEIPDSASLDEREEKLSTVLKNHASAADYWYLNEVMNVKFPRTTRVNIESSTRFEKIKKLFHIILTMGTKSVLFAIDDVEYCDELSWKLIMSVIDSRIKFLIMTMPLRLKPRTAKFLTFPPEVDAHVFKMTLMGLPSGNLASLACQILNARAIPVELESVLISKSNGNPGWCESYLISLSQSNVLKVLELPMWQIKSLGMIIPPEFDLNRKQFARAPENQTSDTRSESLPATIENQTVKQSPREKEKLYKRVSFPKSVQGKNFGYSSDIFEHRPNNYMNVEEAYEDLTQRIQLVRNRPTFNNNERRISHEVITQDFPEVTDGRERVKVLSFEDERDERKTIKCSSAEGKKLKYDEQTENDSNKFITHAKSSEIHENSSDLLIDDNLKETILEIHNRFSNRGCSQATCETSLPLQNKIVVKSQEDIRKLEIPQVHTSKSAENIIHRSKQSTSEAETSENLLHTLQQSNEFSPSALWKTHTQTLMEEAVRIFIKKKQMGKYLLKTKKDFVHKPDYSDAAISISSDSLNSFESSKDEVVALQPSQINDTKTENSMTECPSNFIKLKESVENIPDKTGRQEVLAECNSLKGDLQNIKMEDSKVMQNRIPRVSSLFYKSDKLHLQLKNYKKHETRKSKIIAIFKCWKSTSDSSSPSDSCLEMPSEFDNSNDTLTAVLINPKVNIEEVTSPECFVGVIMSAFDCLGPYEQLMLKCGSILGEKFSRKILNAIMHNPNPYLTAEAVKTLFEMRILCCGSESSESSSLDDCSCFCPLTEADIVDDTLPVYSYCHVLVFKFSGFRSTLYELIPLDQKREFHIRAVQFLEKEQIYCSSCTKLNKIVTSATFYNGSQAAFEDQNRPPSQSPLQTRYRRKISYSESRASISSTRTINNSRKEEQATLLLPRILPSFQKCECLVLKADALKQLINHCVSAGLKKKEFEFVTNYCSVMIILGEFDEAKKILGQVESNLKQLLENSVKSSEKRLIIGRFHLLLGHLSLETGFLKKAHMYLMSALSYFGSKCILLSSVGSSQRMCENVTQKIYQNYNEAVHKDTFLRQQDFAAVCLSLLSNVFMMQEKWKMARTVALRSLSYLRNKDDNFIELCNSYSNVIDIYRHFGNFKFCRKLELAVSKSYIAKFQYKTALELIAIGRLNCSILNTRIISGYLSIASRLGEYALKISQSISFNAVESYVISQVTQIMMMTGNLNRAAGLILRLPVQDVWYHILCLEFALETGFSITNSDQCLDFLWNALNSGRVIEASVKQRAITVVYVWLSRLGRHEDADIWYKKMPSSPHIPVSGDTISNMITIIKDLEGDLLRLASLKIQDIRYSALNKKVTLVIKALHKSTRTTEIILPRFLHLHAYNHYRLNNLPKSLETLHDATKICNSHGNILERSWIAHSKKVWTHTCDFDKDYWLNSAKQEKLIKWCESHDKINWKKYMYSLEYVR